MSVLIDTLDQLQGLHTADRVADGKSSNESTAPPSSSMESSDTSISLGTSGESSPVQPQPAPGPNPCFMPIHPQSWLEIAEKEYLQRYLQHGGSTIKFVVLPDPSGQQGLFQNLEQAASQENCVFAKVDARYTKIHLVDRLFHKIAKQIDWDELGYQFVVRLLVNHGYQIPSERKDFTLQHIAVLNERQEALLQRDIQTWLEETIERDTNLCREFRMAILRLCMAQLNSGESDRVLGNAVKEWLCGELRLISGVKKALIFQKVGRHNARYLFSSLTHWLLLTGKNGLVVTLDISRYLTAKRPSPPDSTLSYSSTAVLDLYDMLRQYIDTADELEGFMMTVFAPPEFLTDPKRGLDRYEALKQRLCDDSQNVPGPNPFLPLVRIAPESTAFHPLTMNGPAPGDQPQETVRARRVIEGLRAGIPNRHVVEALGCPQTEIEWRFRRVLEETQQHISTNRCSKGLIVEGSFGSGKSHVLEYLQNIALESNFICSRIVISKETPLYHPAKLFQAAIESAIIPNKKGGLLTELAGQLDTWAPTYKQFSAWVKHPESGMDSRFAVTLDLHERMGTDRELGHRMARFWTGDPLGIGELKKSIKECGMTPPAFGKISMAELAAQRFQFVARLIHAVGYAGWILLIDEVEVIGRYSANQRTKSYAELARLLGGQDGISYQGIGTVAALTDSFQKEVLEDKGDRVNIPKRAEAEPSEDKKALMTQAALGMQLLESRKVPIEQPTDPLIRQQHDSIRTLHLKAHNWHDWEDPQSPITREFGEGVRMREYVKTWIAALDLKRLAPAEAAGVETANPSFHSHETPTTG